MSKAVGVICGAAVLLAACGGGGGGDDDEAVASWCGAVERLGEFLRYEVGGEDSSPEELEAARDELRAIREEIEANPPESIADDVGLVLEADAGSSTGDDQGAIDEARSTVNEYIREECQVSLTL